MGLLPDTSTAELGSNLEKVVETSNSYKMEIENERIKGSIKDNLEAVKQAVYKALNTERYRFAIYSWDYGVELEDLFGKPMPYAMSEVPRRITECLLVDDRIESVEEFDLSYKGGDLLCKFKVVTIYGDLWYEKVVSIS